MPSPSSKKHARKRIVAVTAADGNGIDQTDDEPRVLPNGVVVAAKEGDTARVVAWLDGGGHVDATWDLLNGALSGVTMLMCAGFGGHTPLLDVLLERGASVDLQNSYGMSALTAAAYHGHLAVVQRLLREGADPGLRADNGNTALSEAERNGHADCARAIKEHVEAAAAGGSLGVDSEVTITGLVNEPQHNGKTARVVGPRGERWAVELEDGTCMSLKPSSMVLSPPATEEALVAARGSEGRWLM